MAQGDELPPQVHPEGTLNVREQSVDAGGSGARGKFNYLHLRLSRVRAPLSTRNEVHPHRLRDQYSPLRIKTQNTSKLLTNSSNQAPSL